MTSDVDRDLLLRIARGAIAAHLTGSRSPATDACEAARQPGAAFVTLLKHGDLRGCIGHMEANDLLGRVIARCAVAACSADPRFPPVVPAELGDLAIELSLLGPLDPIDRPEAIEIGRHGLVVEMGWRRGVLLPQVAVEWRWNCQIFLAETCRKAGLPRDAWLRGARLWRFEAEVFGERTESQKRET